MLLNDFYRIGEMTGAEGILSAEIRLNRHHSIFDGHFPGLPVVPGVCMMQMIREILETHFGKKYILRSAVQVKFLSVINPDEHPDILSDIRFQSPAENELDVVAKLYSGDITFFKLKARLSVV